MIRIQKYHFDILSLLTLIPSKHVGFAMFCSPKKWSVVHHPAAGHVWQLAQHALGCRLVQLALETGCHEAALLTRELHGHVQEAAVSPHANYVIQKARLNRIE